MLTAQEEQWRPVRWRTRVVSSWLLVVGLDFGLKKLNIRFSYSYEHIHFEKRTALCPAAKPSCLAAKNSLSTEKPCFFALRNLFKIG